MRDARSAEAEFRRHYFSGCNLYGDDFGPGEIEVWYRAEQEAYAGMKDNGSYEYAYHGLRWEHGFRHLPSDLRDAHVLAFGCSTGQELEPIAGRIDHVTAIEPGRCWWRNSIVGRPAHYIAPEVSGDILLPEASVDVITAFSALHHVPNVSHVIREFARVLRPGGVALIHEPASTMLDWRRPRPGLTKNERGIPPKWMKRTLESAGFKVRVSPCYSPLLRKLINYNDQRWCRVDALVCRLTQWSAVYHRDRLWKKFGPGAAAYVALKN